MKQHFKKALALLLVLVMVLSVFPVMSFATEEGESATLINGLPADGAYGVIYNADGYLMGADVSGGGASTKTITLSADGNSIPSLPNGAAVVKFIKSGSDYIMQVGSKYLALNDSEELILADEIGTNDYAKWTFVADQAGAAGYYNIKNVGFKYNGSPVYLEVYNGTVKPWSYKASSASLYQFKFYACSADEDGRVGEIMEPGSLPVDGAKVVVYNHYAKAVFGQPTGADVAAPALLPAAATLGADGSLAYEDVEDGGMIFTVHTGVDGGTTWYSFESNGKYLAMPENTVDENGQVGNDETLLMIELPTDPEKVGYTRWTMTQISGGYVMYNVSARYRTNKCCIEYFNDTFSGWTYKASTPELFAMNFFQMEDRDGVGYVVNPKVTIEEPAPAVGSDCEVKFEIRDVSEPTEITASFRVDSKPFQDAEVSMEVRKGSFTVPAFELEGGKTLTVRVIVTDALGKTYDDFKTVDIVDEPLLLELSPLPNAATGDEKKPEISVKFANVGENPVFVMTLDEQTVPAVAEGDKLSYTPAEDLEDGRHSVRVSVTRADGKQAERSWNFFVGRDSETLYFGQLHSHTAEYSDGAGTLENAYMHAADVEDMDFLIVTDHSNYFDTTSTATTSSYYDLSSLLKNAAGTTTKWEEARATAREYDAMFSDLLCVYGYEMTWSGGPGHTNSFNTYGVVSRNNGALNNKTGYAGMHLYNDLMVNAEKGLDINGEEAKTTRDGSEVTGVNATKNIAFDAQGNPVPVVSQFNHPGKTFGNFDNYAGFTAQRDDVLNLIEVGNGEGKVGGSSYFPSYSEYDLCLSKGWHVGPTNNQDNHKGGWGSSNSCRDVILTGDFTEAGLYRALDQRRIYATEDQNLRIFYELEANGETYKLGDIAPIGEDEQPETVTAKIDVTDPDRSDKIATVEIIGEAGKTVHKIDVNDAAWKGEISIPNTDGYYYVRIVEADGEIAVTAPVWVKEAVPVAAELETSASVAVQGEEETVVAKLMNGSESDALTLTGYKVEAEGRTLVEETGLSETVAAGTVKTLEVPFTPSATDPAEKKTYDVSVTFHVLFRGKALEYSQSIQETSYPPEMMTYIGLDRGHKNFYVSGDYAGNETTFLQICADRGIICQYIDEGQMTAENLAKYKAVVLCVPRINEQTQPPAWTEDELNALSQYAANGGSIINFSKSDRYDYEELVDGQDTYKYASATLSNAINEAVGSDTRFIRGIVVDNERKANEAYRINFEGRELIGDHLFTEGIFPSSNGTYQVYNGTGIFPGANASTLLYPYDSTWVASYKANFEGSSYEPDYDNDVVMAPKGSFSLITSEQLPGGGFLLCAGATFITTYDLKYGDPANQQFVNYSLVCNILDYIRDGAFDGVVTPIADVHNGEVGQEFTVEGIVTSNASDYDKDTAFFDCIYVQDETRGINAFPVSGYYFIGEKVRVHGGVTYYCGEIELNLSNDYHGSIKVISNDVTPLEPKVVTCAEAMSDANIGNLMKITGIITDYRATAGVVDEIWVDDGSGEEAMFFINAYIQKESHALDGIEVGMMIEGVGIGSRDVDEASGGADGQIGDDVDPSLFIKRLRVRSRDELEIWGSELDTTALEAAIAEAQGLDRSLYTPESLAAVDEALAAAQAVMNDPDKTQRQVEEAYDALRAALDALELKTEHDLYAPVEALKDGDVVVIYNPGHERAVKNGNYKDWYMLAAEVSFNEDELIQDPADDLLWTVHIDADGNYSFTNGENAITMWKSGTYAELTNNAAIEGGDVLWNLTLGNEEEQLYYFRSKTLVNDDKQGYMECYNKKNADGEYEPFMVGYWSNSPSDKDYGFRFYSKINPGYYPVSSVKDGDVVVIYNPGHERAVKNGNYKDWYMLAGEVSFEEDVIKNPEDDLLWTVHIDADGNYSFTNGENAITMWKSGTYAELTNNAAIEGGDVLWNLTLGNEEEQLYYFRSKTLVNDDKQGYMECYNKKNADGEYEPFMVGYWSNSPSDKDYGFRFYKFAYGPEESEPVGELAGKTIILHTNDTHGALMGFAQAAKVKADLEAQGATVLLVDAGDYSQGNPYVSLSKGETAITVMNAAGYDYATLGNHEFDYGWPQLQENLSKATFKPIVADVIDEATGKSVYDGHVIKEVDGVKIGFFGMETPEAATKANPALMVGLRFPQGEEMYAIAQAEIDALKAEGADLVICLAHLGVDAESEPNRSTDLFAHVTGLDFIIDGHSHTVMTEGSNGEPIQSTGTKASDTALANLGYICIDNATKRIEENKLIPLGADAPVDETVAAVAQAIMDAVDAEYNVVFARSEVELNGDRAPGNRTEETNLGDLITDAMLWSVAKTGGLTVDADHVVAITNGGGIRAWIHAGDVTKKDVNNVLPFGNTVAVVYVSGAELLEALEASTYCTPTAVGGFPQVSGMKFTVRTRESFDQGEQYPGSTYFGPKTIKRVRIDEIGGKAFDPEATYAVVTNNFCAAGGDTYYAFKAATSQFDTGLPLDEVLMDYIVEELDAVIGAEYAEPQGRITVTNLFDDVQSPEQYYFDPVYWAADHDPVITAGIGSNLFGPDVNCTREMVVTFLWKAYGGEIVEEGKAAGFSDVPEDAYYVNAVRWAVAKGVTGGVGGGKFGVGQVCTRAEVVTFLWAAAGKPKPETGESPFTDVKEGDWFRDPVLWAVENGITGGTGDGQFSPAMTCTRAQIVTFLYKAVGKEHSFEFLVTSDLHGQIFATDYTLPYENSGTYSRGLTRVATYIKEQKAAFGENLYVVDMGDTFQGAPLTYHYAFDKPEEKDPAILAFRTIGYDMWVVGNHEFNYGLDILTRQMDYAVSESTETEKQLTISMANYLKAETNNDETKDWATWRDVAPYVIKDFDGCKVAIIGFGNPNVPKWDVPANWEGIYFANIIETYKHYEAEMLEQADMIVVVAHSGTDSDPGSDFMKQLVEETNTIAFAFSGHEHKNTITVVENADGKEISILSPYTKARRIAQVKVEWTGAEQDRTVSPVLVNMEGYPIDEELAELLQPYETETWENYMLQPIGKALGDYPAANLGTAPSAFMDLINTVQTWGAYDNNGENTPDKTEDDTPAMLSISAPLTSGDKANLIAEGDIYLGDMFGLYRFENWFYQITMSGEEVHQWLEFAATKIRVDEEGEPYVTNGDLTYYDVIMGDGFHYEIDVSKPEGERVVKMTWQGADVAPDQAFTVVVNNYRYNGGGNYVQWLNDHGCEFVANDPDRIIYSTQFDMIQGEDEGQARALLVSYIKKETTANGGITPFISSDWIVRNGEAAPEEPMFVKLTEAPADWTEGSYLLVYEADAENGKVFNGADGANGASYDTVTIEDGVIAYDETLFTVSFETVEGGYAIHTANGYMGNVGDKNGVTSSSAEALPNTLSFSEDGILLVSNNRYFRFNPNNNNDRFRYFNVNTTNDKYPLPAVYVLVNAD